MTEPSFYPTLPSAPLSVSPEFETPKPLSGPDHTIRNLVIVVFSLLGAATATVTYQNDPVLFFTAVILTMTVGSVAAGVWVVIKCITNMDFSSGSYSSYRPSLFPSYQRSRVIWANPVYQPVVPATSLRDARKHGTWTIGPSVQSGGHGSSLRDAPKTGTWTSSSSSPSLSSHNGSNVKISSDFKGRI